ncbi:MAG: hypothetical protein ABEJ82_06705 [Haloplanus sp.]
MTRNDAGDGEESPAAVDTPIDGQVIMLAAAKASVGPTHLPDLLTRVQATVGPQADDYRRDFECVYRDDDREVYLVPTDHWAAVGDRVGFSDRETDAVRRAHDEQLLRLGSKTGRREEFETALEIRDAVVVGV